jgi:hypothetical protein
LAVDWAFGTALLRTGVLTDAGEGALEIGALEIGLGAALGAEVGFLAMIKLLDEPEIRGKNPFGANPDGRSM